MKTFIKSFLPDIVTYNQEFYRLNASLSSSLSARIISETSLVDIVKSKGKKCIKVEVKNKQLSGKTDLYGNKYGNSVFIFTT